MNNFEVRNLKCVRGDRPLFEGVGFRLESGELLYLSGANGAGKTSMLRILCGLAQPEAGDILCDDKPTSLRADDYRADLFYLGHQNALQEALTVQENLVFYSALAGRPLDPASARDALARLGLRNCQNRLVRFLSQGQKRRVALSRLMLSRARLWILDEPFVALDQASIEMLAGVLSAHLAGGGLAILTSHQKVDLGSAPVKVLELGA